MKSKKPEQEQADPMPYKTTVTCPKCGRRVLIEAVMGGIVLGLTARRISRLGCPTCTSA